MNDELRKQVAEHLTKVQLGALSSP
jgi:hypothetical protein